MSLSEATEVVALRLRELLLCFPSAVTEGVRWSILRQKYEERYAEPLSLAEPPSSLLDGFATIVSAQSGIMLVLTDAAALMPSRGSIGNWPALYRKLCELIHIHGSVQPPSSLSVTKEDEIATGEVLFAGLLLSQLKPLLQSKWDADFEEHSLGYFDSQGAFVRMRKMKQLVQSMLRWREQHLAVRGPRPYEKSCSTVSAALRVPLDLAVSRRHNDMVLCCALDEGGQVTPRCSVGDPLRSDQRLGVRDIVEPGACIDNTVPKHEGVDGARNGLVAEEAWRARVAALERENLQLRIENVEMKKQVRCSADTFNAQIRMLRVENAELRKRLFGVPARLLTNDSEQMLSTATPTRLLTATMPTAQSSPASAPTSPEPNVTTFDDPFDPPPETHMLARDSWSPGGSGITSPNGYHGAASSTPPTMGVPILYAMVPWHPPILSPMRGQSPLSIQSPMSNVSHTGHLPQGLLDSSGRNSSNSTSGLGGLSPHPDYTDPCALSAALSAADDRYNIPSGIVEQHRTRFEPVDAPDGEAAVGAADAATLPAVAPYHMGEPLLVGE